VNQIPISVGRLRRERDNFRREAEDLRRQNERLQGKLRAAAEAIGLEPGGGDEGYLILRLENLVVQRDAYKRALARIDMVYDRTMPGPRDALRERVLEIIAKTREIYG
jgi:hypothetical protein